MKVLSLFDGISCGMVALERAGVKVERYVAFEIDKYAIKISESNYPLIEHKGDVFKAEYKENEFDLLIGGSPCSYWSIARANRDDRETTASGIGWELFNQYVRALKEAKPKYFLYENNNSMSKEIKEQITKMLGVEPIMIDSALFSAQQRKRLYWTNIPMLEFPKKNISLSKVVPNAYRGAALRNQVTKNGIKPFLNIRNDNKSNCIIAYFNKRNCGYINTIGEYHSFTINELEALQTLPIGYCKCVSDSNARKVIGNGWTVDVIAHIFKGLKS